MGRQGDLGDRRLLPDVPVDEREVDGHDAERGQIMPAETHGDEHEVPVILLVPSGCSKGREQHKPNLVDYAEKTALSLVASFLWLPGRPGVPIPSPVPMSA